MYTRRVGREVFSRPHTHTHTHIYIALNIVYIYSLNSLRHMCVCVCVCVCSLSCVAYNIMMTGSATTAAADDSGQSLWRPKPYFRRRSAPAPPPRRHSLTALETWHVPLSRRLRSAVYKVHLYIYIYIHTHIAYEIYILYERYTPNIR